MAMIASLCLHLTFVVMLAYPGRQEPVFPLGSMVFNYDPLGGEPGGGEAGPMGEGEAQGPPPPAAASETPPPDPVPTPPPWAEPAPGPLP
jgi:hypothetical protein